MFKRLLHISILLIATLGYSQENLYEISLSEKCDSADLIVLGKVVHITSSWNTSNTMIYSANSIEVYTRYKGSAQVDTIIVETVGGRAGNDMVTTSSLLALELNELGIFFLKLTTSGKYIVYSSRQGFLKIDKEGQNLTCPFYSEAIQQGINSIKSITGLKSTTVKSPDLPIALNKSSNSNLCFSPSSISAGTNSVLSISGIGFGSSGPNATDKVYFASANDGGSPVFIEAPLWTYLSWTDTLIKVIVPTAAGTGPIHIEVSGSTYIPDSVLIIPFSVINNGNGAISRMIAQNIVNGHTWTIGTNMVTASGGIGDIPFKNAMDTWKCATGVNWTIAPTPVALTNANANDGYNLVSLNLFLPNGVLGVCYTYSSTCNGSDWYITGQDILFDFLTVWNVGSYPPGGSQHDFETVALHELGHAHVLGHVVDNDDAMHYSVGQGVMKRNLTASNIIAGNYVMNISENQPVCGQPAVVEVFPLGCSEPSLTDVTIISMTDIPNDSTCFGLLPIHVSFGNIGVDTVTQIEWEVSINGTIAATVNWSGSLAMNEEVMNFYLGDFNFQDSSYTLQIWAASVNGLTELDHSNDSIYFSFHPTSCSPDDASLRITSSLDASQCQTIVPILATLVNPGENVLNSCQIYVKANGILFDSLNWTGSIDPGDSVQGILITNYPLNQDENDFIVWTAIPNGVPDTYPVNDTSTYTFNRLPLQGTYTIGGISPDIPTISDAFIRLSQYGICGDVTLNIRDGLYLEQLYLSNIPSTSSQYQVLVQSENMNANLVSIKNTNTISQQSGLILDNVSNVTFRNLTFLPNDPAPQTFTILEIKNGSNNINISQNKFFVSPGTVLPIYPAVLLVPVNATSNTLQDIVINGNKFENFRSCIETSINSFFTGHANNLTIDSNEFYGHRNSALIIQRFGKIKISNNKSISNQIGWSTDGGFHVEQWLDTVEISNNHIIDSAAAPAIRVELFQGNTANSVVRIFNNSITHIRLTASNFPGPTVDILGVPNLDFIHNSVHSYYPSTFVYDDPVLKLTAPNPLSANVRNNILVGKGGVNQIINTAVPYTASNNVFWFDGSAYPIEPDFMSPTYLVPMNSFELNNLGLPISYISTDIVGIQRSTVTPDAGAHEFHPFEYDIEIDHTTLFQNTVICPNDSLEMTFNVTNNGTHTIDSFYVYWSVANDAFDTTLVYQTILPQQSETINLGYQTFSNAYTTIDVICDLPNGYYDSLPSNNSYQFEFYTKLSGTYSVGNPSANFPTIEHVKTALNLGLCGPVVFNLVDGVYEQFGILDFVPNSSSINTITFQSESLDTSAVHITGLTTTGSMRVLGMKYVNFKYLTFLENIILDSVKVIKFDYCRFYSSGFNHSNMSSSQAVDSLSILNSHLIDSDIRFDHSPCDVNNVELRFNVFEGNSEIVFEAISSPLNHTNVLISQNTFSVTGLNSYDAAIFFYDYLNVEVDRNSITCGFTNAIEFYRVQTAIIKNNFIYSGYVGLKFSACGNVKVYSNSLYCQNSIQLFANPNLIFKNNIFQKLGPATVPFFYFNSSTQAAGIAEFNTDNNLFFGVATDFIYHPSLPNISYAVWQSVYNKDVNSLIGDPGFFSSTDLHVNSSIADSTALPMPEVLFDFDGEPRDLLYPDLGADEFTINLSSIFDISIDAINHPSPASCFVDDSIIFTLTNNYSDTLFSAQIQFTLNGNTSSVPWFGALASGQSQMVYLGTGNFTAGVNSSLTISVSSPNGGVDYNQLNNTMNLVYFPFIGVEIGSICDYDAFLEASSADLSTQYLWNSGETTNTIFIDSVTSHWVQGTNVYGCVSYDSVSVSDVLIPIPRNIVASDTIFCTGENVNISASPIIPGTSYDWNNFPVDVYSFNTSTAALIILIATDSDGCVTSDSLEISSIPTPFSMFTILQDTILNAPYVPVYNYTWLLNGQPIPGADSSRYTMTQNGQYSLIMEYQLCSDLSSTYNFTSLGVSQSAIEVLEIYPNPTGSVLWIKNSPVEFSFFISDSQGRIVLIDDEKNTPEIDLRNLASGSYFISIRTHDGEYHFQFVKSLEE